MHSSQQVTQILQDVANGNQKALDALLSAVYQDLRELCHQRLQRERHNHTLQPTALVHEAYLRLIDQDKCQWNDRNHFFALASQAIRRVLVDHARARNAEKRGSGAKNATLSDTFIDVGTDPIHLLALDEALTRLGATDPQAARVVEMRYFAGQSDQEIASVLQISRRTVQRLWAFAKAYLYQQMNTPPNSDS